MGDDVGHRTAIDRERQSLSGTYGRHHLRGVVPQIPDRDLARHAASVASGAPECYTGAGEDRYAAAFRPRLGPVCPTVESNSRPTALRRYGTEGTTTLPAQPASEIRLHFLGSGDAFGNGARYQTCFWLEGTSQSMLIDCGATSLTALKARGVEPNEIGSVVLTHLHGDHFGGLPFLILDGQFRRRERTLTIAGPPGTRGRVEALMELFFPGSLKAPRRFDVEYVEIEARIRTPIGDAVVTAVPVEQPGTPACALRIEYGGRVVAYTGDTDWTEELIDVAAGADVFVAEAYFFERRVPFHLDYKTLLGHRDRLDCRRMVLTHMSPDMLARQSEAEFECAYDGMVVRA